MAADEGKLTVAGISAEAPFMEVARRASPTRYKTEKWVDIECMADVLMDSAMWGEEPSDGLFNRPVLFLSGRVIAIHSTEIDFFDGVKHIEFPLGDNLTEEEVAAETMGLNMRPEDAVGGRCAFEDAQGKQCKSKAIPGSRFCAEHVQMFRDRQQSEDFAIDSTMAPRVEFCYRFTFNELALLAVRGGMMEIPPIPERVLNNQYFGMPMTCDITRLTDRMTGHTFWAVDLPGEAYTNEIGRDIETSTAQCGYQLVTEIPEVKSMAQFGDYIDLPGIQRTKPFTDYSDELSAGDFDLSRALFQDDDIPFERFDGEDVEIKPVEPMVTPENEEEVKEVDQDHSLVSDLLESALQRQESVGLESSSPVQQMAATHEATEQSDTHMSIDDVFSMVDAQQESALEPLQKQPEEQRPPMSTFGNFGSGTFSAEDVFGSDVSADVEDFSDFDEAFASEDESDIHAESDDERSRKRLRRLHQMEQLEREQHLEEVREKAASDKIDAASYSDEELSNQLFGN